MMKVYLTPKTLKKIIKMLVLFILACILIFYSETLNVKADTTTANINSYDITFPTAITWYDYINSTYISKGNSTQVISISSLNDYLSFSAPSSTLSTSNGGSGATIRFNTDIISPNHSYVLYLYLIDRNSTTYSPSYSYLNSFELCNSSLTTCNNPTELLFSGRGQKSQYENYYITNLIYRFTSTGTASSYGVQVHFSSDTQVSFVSSNPQRGFIGYKLIDVTDYSNTTIEGMIQDNQNSLNQLEDDMVILQETQEATNDKLDEQLKQDQEQHEEQMEQDKQQHEETMDTITDTTAPDTSGLSNAAGWLPPGPVDSLVNLPINLLNSLLGNIGSTCNSINLTLPFVKKDFTIPCPTDLLNRLGDNFLTFWESMGLIAGCWCLYKYFINLYKWVESALTMDEKEQLGKWGGV